MDVVHDSLPSGTIDDPSAALQAMLAAGESVVAQYIGPVLHSPHDLLLALTEHHAIAILRAWDASLPIKRLPPSDRRLRIPRAALVLASASPLTVHEREDGTVLTGGSSVFIEGFNFSMLELPTARLSTPQHQALRELVAAWGEPLLQLDPAEADYRHEHRARPPPISHRAGCGLMMILAAPVLLLSGACEAAWKKLRS